MHRGPTGAQRRMQVTERIKAPLPAGIDDTPGNRAKMQAALTKEKPMHDDLIKELRSINSETTNKAAETIKALVQEIKILRITVVESDKIISAAPSRW